MRYLSLDYGDSRTGIAISDPTRTIAQELAITETKNIFSELSEILEKYEISKIIVGHPISVSQSKKTEQTEKVEKFVKTLTSFIKETGKNIEIHLFDERFTSTMVHRSLKSFSKKPKHIDGMSACVLLQEFLERG